MEVKNLAFTTKKAMGTICLCELLPSTNHTNSHCVLPKSFVFDWLQIQNLEYIKAHPQNIQIMYTSLPVII